MGVYCGLAGLDISCYPRTGRHLLDEQCPTRRASPAHPSPLSLYEQMEIQELLELGFMPSEVIRIYTDAGCSTRSLLHYLYPPPFGGTGGVPPTHQPSSGRRCSK